MRDASRLTVAIALFLAGSSSSGCRSELAPSPPVETVDALDFLIGDATLWPRVGSHYMHQIVDLERREICWVKYFNPRRFECWRWDDAFVYHETDNAIDGNTGESYHFSDGRWMPRRVPVGDGLDWSLDVPDNRLEWFTPQCTVDSARSGAFPYRQRAWFEPRLDAGGDLGVRDTVVLEYAPYDPASGRSNPERFYFARRAGWYRWERADAESHFLSLFGMVVSMDRSVLCGMARTDTASRGVGPFW